MKQLNHDHPKNNHPYGNDGHDLSPNQLDEETRHRRKREKFSPGESQDYNPEDFSTD